MFQNSRISFIIRLICLICFIVVILLINSFITLSLLTIAFYLFTRNESDETILLWHIITFVIFLICYFIGNYILLKLTLSIGLAYYFIIVPKYTLNKKVIVKNKVVVDKYFIRFKNNQLKREDGINKNLINAIYVAVHLFILFISIMVG